jgi:hypothetical protein
VAISFFLSPVSHPQRNKKIPEHKEMKRCETVLSSPRRKFEKKLYHASEERFNVENKESFFLLH